MSVTDDYRKELPTKILKEIEFRYGALLLDGFDIVDVRARKVVLPYGEKQFGIFLEMKKK